MYWVFEYSEFVGAMVIDMFGQNETFGPKQYFCGATAFDISLLLIYTALLLHIIRFRRAAVFVCFGRCCTSWCNFSYSSL